MKRLYLVAGADTDTISDSPTVGPNPGCPGIGGTTVEGVWPHVCTYCSLTQQQKQQQQQQCAPHEFVFFGHHRCLLKWCLFSKCLWNLQLVYLFFLLFLCFLFTSLFTFRLLSSLFSLPCFLTRLFLFFFFLPLSVFTSLSLSPVLYFCLPFLSL